MTHTGPLNGPTIACTFDPSVGRAQVEKWLAFDEDYALETERTDTRLTIHYAKVDDSIHRLRELVAVESSCCAFVDWTIDETQTHLLLTVTGTPEQLAALNIG